MRVTGAGRGSGVSLPSQGLRRKRDRPGDAHSHRASFACPQAKLATGDNYFLGCAFSVCVAQAPIADCPGLWQCTGMNTALETAIEIAGGAIPLAEALGISRQAVQQWKQVPPERVLQVERITGVSRYALRPDVYGSPPRNFLKPVRPKRRAESRAA